MMPALPVGAAIEKTVAEVDLLSDGARLKTVVLARAEGVCSSSLRDGAAWRGLVVGRWTYCAERPSFRGLY